MPLFNPNFALLPRITTTIPVLLGIVDGYPATSHELRVHKSDSPLETGASLTDHAVKAPDKLDLDGWVSDISLVVAGFNITPPLGTQAKPALAWQAIRRLMEEREPVSVITAWHFYQNMLLTQASAREDRSSGGALRFSLKLEEVLFVGVETAELTPEKVKDDAADRTSMVDRGEVMTTTSPVFDELIAGFTAPATNPFDVANFVPPV